MKINKKMFFLYTISLVILIYIGVLTSLYFFQRNLMYHPVENNYHGDALKVKVEKVKIKTSDNLELLAWYHVKDIKKFKTIIYLHGNAGSLENRIHKINNFKDMNVNFLLLAWRGFSKNKGVPTEGGLYEDARSALKWLENKGIETSNVIIYGESLGTAVATEIAQNKEFAGIILESPFTSMIEAAKTKYPIFPIKFLLKDKYESDKKIKNITSPILIMHGKKDDLVPFWMGQKMLDLANEPKFFYFPEYDDHMMEFNQDLLNSLDKFIKGLN
tara:strand:+ start:248 stop:1066 length:819 start_codon:yes stop_codon:yes gene_type:complete